MKNQKYQKSYVPFNVDSSYEEMSEEIIEDKQLYNWLYQQEEEDYYSGEKVSASLLDFLQEALF